jgi:hypothetical protein
MGDKLMPPRPRRRYLTPEQEEEDNKFFEGLTPPVQIDTTSATPSFNREASEQSLFGKKGPVAQFGGAVLDTALDTELPLMDFRGNTMKIREIPEAIGNAADEIGSIFTGEAIGQGIGMISDIHKAANDPNVPPGTIPKGMARGIAEGVKDMTMGGIGEFKKNPIMTATGAGFGPKMAKTAIKGAANTVRRGGKALLADQAGVPSELLGDISEQRSIGPNAKFGEFERGMRMTPEELTQDVQQKVAVDLPDEGRRKHLEGMSRLEVPEGGLDPLGLLVGANNKLAKHRITIGRDGIDYSKSRISRDTEAQNTMNDMIETINEGIHSQDPREIAESLSIAYDMVENIPPHKDRVRRYMRDVWREYRDAVGEQIPGYNSVQLPAKARIEALEAIREVLFATKDERRLRTMTERGIPDSKLTSALDHIYGPQSTRKVQAEFVDKLSKMVEEELGEKVDFKRLAGGVRVAGDRRGFWRITDPIGLGPGMLGFAATGEVTTAMGLQFLSVVGKVIGAATIQQPRVAMQIAKSFGMSRNVVKQIGERAEEARQWFNSLTPLQKQQKFAPMLPNDPTTRLLPSARDRMHGDLGVEGQGERLRRLAPKGSATNVITTGMVWQAMGADTPEEQDRTGTNFFRRLGRRSPRP